VAPKKWGGTTRRGAPRKRLEDVRADVPNSLNDTTAGSASTPEAENEADFARTGAPTENAVTQNTTDNLIEAPPTNNTVSQTLVIPSSDSDSDHRPLASFTRKPKKTMSKQAEVEIIANKAPILTAGTLTPETLKRFENGCRNYFRMKKVEAKEQVASIAGNMQDDLISDWYWTDEVRINALTFENFLKEMRTKWLKKGWQKDIRRRVLGTKQNGEAFWDWAVRMRGLNALLRDTPSHLSDAILQSQLDANFDATLCTACDEDEVGDIADFEEWLAAVKEVDERVKRDRLQAKADAEEAARMSGLKHTANAAGFGDNSRKANVPATMKTMAAKSIDNRGVPAAGTTSKLTKLTPEEHGWLKANGGCFKCRQVGHLARDCPDGDENVPKAGSSSNADGQRTRPQTSKSINAIVENDNVAPVQIVATTSYPVAAIMPPANSSCVLSEEGASDDEVSLHSVPLTVPHLRWKATIESGDPLCLSRPTIDTMLDHGSHLVLIRPELVENLKLRKRSLKNPIPIGLALEGKDPGGSFHEWVKLKLYDPSNLWEAKAVHAVIAVMESYS
jgi:hypothetical protein